MFQLYCMIGVIALSLLAGELLKPAAGPRKRRTPKQQPSEPPYRSTTDIEK